MNTKRTASLSMLVIIGLILFIGVPFLVRIFFIMPYRVQLSSMQPTLQENNLILVNRFIYKYKDPKRGDIITFHPPHNHNVTYLKRVIAVPGETIEIKEGFVWINGEKIQESYLSCETLGQTKPLRMGLTEYFVMGDRRNYSLDSREFGPVQKNEIIGKAFFVLYPKKYTKIL